jgi:hypothetical protein
MILRPDPPNWPCSGSKYTTGEWKCCSKSLFRISMDVLSSARQLELQRREHLNSQTTSTL